MRRRVAAAAVAALMLAAAGAAATADPRAYVLQPRDLPGGFSLDKGGYFSQPVAGQPIKGYEAAYAKPGILDGLIRVASRAALFPTPAAAHRLITVLFASPATGYRRLAVSWRLGDESRFYIESAAGTSSHQRLAVYTVVWRSGRVVGSLNGGGIAGTFPAADVVALARKQQARMPG